MSKHTRRTIIASIILTSLSTLAQGQAYRYSFDRTSGITAACEISVEFCDAKRVVLHSAKIFPQTGKPIAPKGYFNFDNLTATTLWQTETLKFSLLVAQTKDTLDVMTVPNFNSKDNQLIINKTESERLLALENILIEAGLQKEVTFWYNGELVTYGVVKFRDRYWMDRNLGAARAASNIRDSLALGDLFQWGREADGHQLRDNTATTTELALAGQQPNHNAYIIPKSGGDWSASPSWVTRWPVGNPSVASNANACPSGWHVPNSLEWKTAIGAWKNLQDAFRSPLKLTNTTSPNIKDDQAQGTSVHYWSSSAAENSLATATFFTLYDGANVLPFYNRYQRRPIRCIKDAVPIQPTGNQ